MDFDGFSGTPPCMTVTVRFAPSPTGKIHVGNVRTALQNYLFAKGQGGHFLLRIDDTDLDRSTKAYEAGIEEDLAWLGIQWDSKESQSNRFARYDAAAETLKSAGLLYPAYETGEELDRQRKLRRAQGLPPVYDRSALNLTDADREKLEAEGRQPHWRFRLSQETVEWEDMVRGHQTIDTASLSDPVLIRADGTYLYTLPSVVDDIELKVSHVIRGEDHVTNSAAQAEIFRALNADVPHYAHTPLLVGADGSKLSKRLGTLAVAELREEGIEAMAINSLLAKLGTSDAIEPRMTMDALIEEFSFDKIGRAPARFDPAELRHINARILHETPYADIADRLAALGVTGGEPLWNAVRANVETLNDVKTWQDIIDGPVTPDIEDSAFAEEAANLLPETLDDSSWGDWTNAVKAATGRKGRDLFMPLRKALLGQAQGPEMGPVLALIGREKAKARLKGQRI